MNKKGTHISIIIICIVILLGGGILAKDTVLATISPTIFLGKAIKNTDDKLIEESEIVKEVFQKQFVNGVGYQSDTQLQLISVAQNGTRLELKEALTNMILQITRATREDESLIDISLLNQQICAIKGSCYTNKDLFALKLEPFVKDYYTIQKATFVEDFNNSVVRKLTRLPELDGSFDFETLDVEHESDCFNEALKLIIKKEVREMQISSLGKQKIDDENYFLFNVTIEEITLKKVLLEVYDLVMTDSIFQEAIKQQLLVQNDDKDTSIEEQYEAFYNTGEKRLGELKFKDGITFKLLVNTNKYITQIECATKVEGLYDQANVKGKLSFGSSHYLTDDIEIEFIVENEYDQIQMFIQSEHNYGEKEEKKFQTVSWNIGNNKEKFLDMNYRWIYNPNIENDNFTLKYKVDIMQRLALSIDIQGTYISNRDEKSVSIDSNLLKIGVKDGYNNFEIELKGISYIQALEQIELVIPESEKEVLKLSEKELFKLVFEVYGNVHKAKNVWKQL
ncbi:hypothetical protein PBV87_15780 [Niameybacter massiliensis]|uniref:Uncharacterized protein n=1 Tax=Holtiella tumoricola TaxID=3018743 RepID=A0AA42DQD9_9FIRM|nr:hypothetical protein [Holtiella tumoricola]MDA3732936.1 hypothetical protein [Holtiella tumoricola]